MSGPPIIFACSPRSGGNSDAAARAFAAGIEESGGTSTTVYLRDQKILPCKGCSACNPSGRCILRNRDDVESLFACMEAAPFVLFAAPIYFYHVPALFKGFIDRGQSRYVCLPNRDQASVPLPRRRAYVALCAGRPRGENLFKGSLLTLKYFLDVFGFSLHDPELFRSMDDPGDFMASAAALGRMRSLGREAWKQAVRHRG
ncbi:FMN reductase [Desulfoplanes formicivorans]|uniref:FMN reductase n=1 Tax=Desulfoplanes formicivorans TaxID=1592317 RepID=A0A194AG35_9BACT|nr:FMN reductase [Desulfoplanes formicivorans]